MLFAINEQVPGGPSQDRVDTRFRTGGGCYGDHRCCSIAARANRRDDCSPERVCGNTWPPPPPPQPPGETLARVMAKAGRQPEEDPTSDRGSFSVPVHINLLNARRKQPRQMSRTVSEADGRSQARYRGCGDRLSSPALMSSVGEDRALLLGFVMMGFAVLMYFLFGLTLVRPYLRSFSSWKEESNCTLIRAEIREDRVDCKEQGSYPCLQVWVNLSVFANLSLSARPAVLQYDDDPVLLATKCFSVPRCQRSRKEVLEEARKIQQYLRERGRSPFLCHGSAEEQPERATLFRKYDGGLVTRYMLWATLVLTGGVGIVGLVKVNQRLSCMCDELEAQAGDRRRRPRT
ncbi:calcium-activated potassium channel subunit beta-3-like [Arapaima gigas]